VVQLARQQRAQEKPAAGDGVRVSGLEGAPAGARRVIRLDDEGGVRHDDNEKNRREHAGHYNRLQQNEASLQSNRIHGGNTEE
jgi:hypothetical protein